MALTQGIQCFLLQSKMFIKHLQRIKILLAHTQLKLEHCIN